MIAFRRITGITRSSLATKYQRKKVAKMPKRTGSRKRVRAKEIEKYQGNETPPVS